MPANFWDGTLAAPTTARARATVLAALLAFGGCATSVGSLPLLPGPPAAVCCTRGEDPIQLQYLGVGGWLLRVGESALLTAPFFSNPGLLTVALGRPIRTDTVAVDRFLPPVDDVEVVLVGHAHYDHLMDVPYLLRSKAPRARVYGSRTAVNTLLADPGLDPERLVSVEDAAGDPATPGEWIYAPDGRIRFMALRSEHAPHFMGIHLYEGQRDAPPERLPERPGEWLEGTPLAFLIDVLTPSGEVAYRIHYQDAASEPPAGFPPHPGDGVPVDLAILCPPGSEEVTAYPEGILERLRPRAVLLGHWEDFFQQRSEPLRGVPGTDLDEFVLRVRAVLGEASFLGMLEPGDGVVIGPAGP